MAQGSTRNDTTNNIANTKTINADDLDGEFNAIQLAMDATTGHTHDGTTGGGAPIVSIGPVQDVVITTSALRPKTDNTVDLGTSADQFKDLYVNGTAYIDTLQVDESATITANLTVNGNTTLGNAATDTVTVNADIASNLIPSADNTHDLGSATDEWRNIYVDGTAQVDTLQVDESATITANLTVNGNTVLGDADTDTVTVNADIASSLIPDADNTYDLGISTNEWRNLYIDGTAQVDTLQVDESATIAANLTVTGNATITTNLTVNGNTTLGNADTDTVTVTADVASNLIPSADNTYDLGATGSEWKDLYITGTANIDSLVADTAAISAGTATLSAATIITSNGGNLTLQRNDTSVETGDTLGAVDFQAPNESSGGDAVLVAASIKAVAKDTFSSTVNKTSLIFQTAADGDVVTRMEITGDGNVLPNTDNAYDLGSNTREWKDLWITGTANIDSLVADTADINGGTIDATTIGATTPAAGTFTSVTAPSVTITGGTINGTTIGATTAAAGTFTNITATGGTITGITDLAVADGGTGVSTITGYVKGNGTSAFTGSASIPNTDITGLGTMSTQAASAVAITGGSINGTTIGATTTSTIAGTTGTFSDIVSVTVSSASDAVRITQTGAGNALLVEDSANPDSTPFVVTATGLVGLGTTSPNEELQIRKDNASGLGAVVALANVNSSGATGNQVGIGLSAFTDLAINSASYRGTTIVAETSASGNSHDLIFSTSSISAAPAERLKITSTGSLILTGSTAQKATGTTWSNPSDQRLKYNITNYPKGIPELMQVRVCEWEYNGKGGTVEGEKGIGVIADEVMTVLPNTVETYDAKLNAEDEKTTAIKKFDATEITWLLVKAVQEQQAIIVALEARLTALEAK